MVRQATFTRVNEDPLPAGLRAPRPFGASLAQDLEPEFPAISRDSSTAFVTLQENNGVAVVNLEAATVTELLGLGAQDHRLAGNGLDALKILEDDWIDLVLADLHMPEMTGIEMIEEMAKRDMMAGVPAIIISSDHSQTRIDELSEKGIKAYLKKPFKPEELRDAMEDALGVKSGGSYDG